MSEHTAIQTATQQLVEAIRRSEEYQQFSALKESVMSVETNRALLKEYQRTQTRLQMAAASGVNADAEDVERFNKLSALLYMNGDMAQYLMAQMRMQQLAGEVFQQVVKAAELDLELPGM